MFTSVKNSSLNYLKKEKIKGKMVSELTHLIEHDELYDPGLFIASELQNQVQEAFNKLPQRTREIFILSRFKGQKNDEIAGQLNLSKRTVETQISNALRILRVELKDYFTLLLFF
jgi:RNA polymerase sigma-70 factor (ECF subfamily)